MNPSDPPADPKPTPFSARRALMAFVSVSAAAGGAWWAWRPGTPTAASQNRVQAQVGDPLPAGFWAQQFDTPAGTPLALSGFQGKPLLVNFWASWCGPCVKEMPELDHFHQTFQAQGGQVLGLAIDGPTPVRAFLAKTTVGFPIGLAGLGGTELAAALGNAAGVLPFTVLVSAQGRIVQRKLGATTLQELSAWAKALG